jgi:hypothetical protein
MSPGRVPRTITDAQVEEVVVRTLEETPEGATHWSKRELAKRTGISPTSVHRIWRAFGLQPRRTEDFKISPDPWVRHVVSRPFLLRICQYGISLIFHPDIAWVRRQL